jgi:hypothetical protein
MITTIARTNRTSTRFRHSLVVVYSALVRNALIALAFRRCNDSYLQRILNSPLYEFSESATVNLLSSSRSGVAAREDAQGANASERPLNGFAAYWAANQSHPFRQNSKMEPWRILTIAV